FGRPMRIFCISSAGTTAPTSSRARSTSITETCASSRFSISATSARTAAGNLPLAPLQLSPKHFEVAARRRPNQAQRFLRTTHPQLVVRAQLEARLAVEGGEHLVLVVHLRLNSDRRHGRNDDRPIGE